MEENRTLTSHDLLFDVLGTRFSINIGEDPAYLEEILAQYKVAVANTQGISGMKDPLNIAILTGFLLCDEINRLKTQAEEEKNTEAQEVNRITRDIIERLDQAIDG